MNKQWIALGALAAIIVLPVTFKLLRSGDAKKVDVETVSMRTLTPSILASGALTYESQVTLTPEISGRVKEILVDEGDVVKAGQLLLRLDPEAARADIAQIEAALRQSALNIERLTVSRDAQIVKWKRNEQLKEKGLIDASQFDDFVTQKEMADVELRASREEYKQSEARLAQARERLSKTETRSPIAGEVTAIFIKEGETAIPSATGSSLAGSTLMQVADTTSIYAEINIDETDVARVKVGAEAKIVPAAFPDKSMVGKVEHVAIWPKQTSGQSKIYTAKIRLAVEPGVTFHPGMSCRAEVLTNQAGDERAVAVPVQAVKYEESDKKSEKSKTSVFVYKDGRVAKRSVETGTADDNYIAVTKGLQPDERIVVGPTKTLNFLRDGERVAMNETSAGGASAPVAAK
jgi:HlyD family secretion protein